MPLATGISPNFQRDIYVSAGGTNTFGWGVVGSFQSTIPDHHADVESNINSSNQLGSIVVPPEIKVQTETQAVGTIGQIYTDAFRSQSAPMTTTIEILNDWANTKPQELLADAQNFSRNGTRSFRLYTINYSQGTDSTALNFVAFVTGFEFNNELGDQSQFTIDLTIHQNFVGVSKQPSSP